MNRKQRKVKALLLKRRFQVVGFCFALLLILGIGFQVFREKKMPKKSYLRRETMALLLDEKKLQEKLSKDPPQWMKQQIVEDFSGFSTATFSSAQVDETFSTIRKNYPHPWIVRYRIFNRELYRYFPEGEPISVVDNQMEKALKTLIRYIPFTELDFIFSYFDGIPLPEMPKKFYYTINVHLQAPILSFSKIKNTPYVILVPDWRSTSATWASDIENLSKKVGEYPWERKKNLALWRGGLTRTSRLKLCQLASRYPEYLDAKLNSRAEDPLLQKQIEEEGLFGSRVSWNQLLSCKYLPVLDNVCGTAPALQWRLLSNSVVFKQDSEEIQWFYRALSPYVHYIPVRHDLEDLIEKIHWARRHDRACKEMAAQSTNFILNHLMMEDVYLYLYLVLNHYASLQTLHKKTIEKEIKSDPRWVNIQHRTQLRKIVRKKQKAGYISSATPF